VRVIARGGLLGRGLFYLLLAALAINVASGHSRRGAQANANGALVQVARTSAGLILLAAVALGFAAFGVIRLAGAYGDRQHGRLRRLSTAGQAVLYLLMAAGTVSFLLGRHSTGSEQQQRSATADVLGLPAGRVLVAVIGLVVLAICGWQLRVGIRGYYADSLNTDRMPAPIRRATHLLATVGILARALAFAPIGVLLLLAAARAAPHQAKGLDGLLADLARTGWGRMLIWLVAAGFVTFAGYTFLEARYRRVDAGH